MKISVILCIYNCEDRIALVLDSILFAYKKFNDELELIVVDNNSKDSSLQIAREYNYESLKFTILEEKQQGLIYSRIKGVSNSDGRIGIFIDDDNLVDENYFLEAYEYISRNKNIYAVGGQISPDIVGIIPSFFFNYGGDYAVGVQSLSDGTINERAYLWGAGMVTRLDIVRALYAQMTPLLTGRLGDEKSAGEDGELVKWLRILGGEIAYTHKLKIKHMIPQSRLKIKYLKEVQNGFKRAVHIQRVYDLVISIIGKGVSPRYRLKALLYGMNSIFKIDINTLFRMIKNIKILLVMKI